MKTSNRNAHTGEHIFYGRIERTSSNRLTYYLHNKYKRVYFYTNKGAIRINLFDRRISVFNALLCLVNGFEMYNICLKFKLRKKYYIQHRNTGKQLKQVGNIKCIQVFILF